MCASKFYSSACTVVVMVSAVSLAAEIGASKPASTESLSTTITAQKMTVRNQESKAIFEGTVVLTKGALVVHSDTMVVSFKPTGSSAAGIPDRGAQSGAGQLPIMSNRSVSMIEATGRVRIEKAEGRATSKKAIYYANEEKIVLTGEPVAWQKGTRVSGKKITMYLAEDRSVVEGGSHVMIDQDGGEGR